MKKIYTRSGDRGMTRIFGGEKVPKTDQRIETNGSLDELNTSLGLVRSFLAATHPWQELLKEVQLTLMALMSHVATPSTLRQQNPNILPTDMIEKLEAHIDAIAAECSEADSFILPGGTQLSAFLHQARVTARRAERNMWRLNEIDSLPEQMMVYVNRLSDLLFVMARKALQDEGMDEERWQLFTYKKHLRHE